jgi:hypothetical protein
MAGARRWCRRLLLLLRSSTAAGTAAAAGGRVSATDGEAGAVAEVVKVDGHSTELLEQGALDHQLVALTVHDFVRVFWLIQSQAPRGPASPNAGDVHPYGSSVGVFFQGVPDGFLGAVGYFDHNSILVG